MQVVADSFADSVVACIASKVVEAYETAVVAADTSLEKEAEVFDTAAVDEEAVCIAVDVAVCRAGLGPFEKELKMAKK